MGDNRRTKSCLVREHAASHTLFDNLGKGVAENTAADSLKVKCLFKDKTKGSRNVVKVNTNRRDRHNNKNQGHKRNEHRGNLADTLNTADNNDTSDNRNADTDEQLNQISAVGKTGARKRLVNCARNFVSLNAAHTDSREHTENRRHISEPFPL